MAESFAGELAGKINEAAKRRQVLTVALSGGSTPNLLFSLLGDHFSKSVRWEFVHFFWGDERCVPPENEQSNFGMAYEKLFSKIVIPPENIHRIFGENNPDQEAERYSWEILSHTRKRDGLPVFNIIILGLGEDGHTASIFPGHSEMFNSAKICAVAVHPHTYQKRITITGKVINNADSVIFLVTGKKKAEVVEKVVRKSPCSEDLPASYICPVSGHLSWYLDVDSGSLL
jgi:6-phosphogluconolactonase